MDWKEILIGVGIGVLGTFISILVARKSGQAIGAWLSFYGLYFSCKLLGKRLGTKVGLRSDNK